MRYPIAKEDPKIRTHESQCQDVKNTQRLGKFINGVKGFSILLSMVCFDIVWSLPVDYMHGVLLGVTRQLLKLWIKFFFTKDDIKRINLRIQNIKLIRDIRRNPRTLDYLKKFKATEWKTWLLFMSLPCLLGILPKKLFQSFAYLVQSIYILCKEKNKQRRN